MSIATTIRQRYEAKEQDQQQKASARYRQLVRAVAAAAGKEPSLEQIEQTAAAAGKTIADFTAAVEGQEKRIATAARLAAIPDKRTRRAELQQAIEAHNATLDEAIERHRQACEPLVAQANELDAQIEQADRLKLELISTADPEVIAAIDAAGEEHLQADVALRLARQEIEIASGNGSTQLLERHAGKPGFDHQHHERIVADAKAAAEQLPALEKALADAESRYRAAQARLLEP